MFFTFSFVVRDLEFIFISHLFFLICHDILVLSERKRKCRLGRLLMEVSEFSVTRAVGGHLLSQPGYVIYYLVKDPLSQKAQSKANFSSESKITSEELGKK